MKITVDDGSTVSTQKGLLCILQSRLVMKTSIEVVLEKNRMRRIKVFYTRVMISYT